MSRMQLVAQLPDNLCGCVCPCMQLVAQLPWREQFGGLPSRATFDVYMLMYAPSKLVAFGVVVIYSTQVYEVESDYLTVPPPRLNLPSTVDSTATFHSPLHSPLSTAPLHVPFHVPFHSPFHSPFHRPFHSPFHS